MPSRGHTTASLPCHSSSPQTLPLAPLNTEVGGGGAEKLQAGKGCRERKRKRKGRKPEAGVGSKGAGNCCGPES